MTNRPDHERERVVFSASSVLDILAESLSAIRRDDKLTFADMAAVLGKSEDQAGKYASGQQEMGVIAYARAKREWNGRFTGALDRLCVDSRPSAAATDRAKGSAVLKAALALSVALEDDDAIDCHEVRANRGTLENARDAINELLGKLAPKEVAK
jgi:predicted transcriptional regulator